MRTPLFHPLVVIAGSLLVAHQFTQKVLGWSLPFIDSYLDPCTGMIVLLAARETERRSRGIANYLRNTEIGVLTVLTVVIFEGIIPRFHPGFTADWWDVPAYFFGALLFWLAIPPPREE